jgi:hypothetical protein
MTRDQLGKQGIFLDKTVKNSLRRRVDDALLNESGNGTGGANTTGPPAFPPRAIALYPARL